MRVLAATAIVVATFVVMETVAALAHRFVMHGPGMGWHRSHHVPHDGRLERNDLFPLFGAAAAVTAFALGAWSPYGRLTWVGTGMTAYGVAYLFVHDVYVHRRVRVPLPRWRYFEHLRDAHRVHHLYGRAPYGFVCPVVPRALREQSEAVTRDPFAPAPR